MSALLVAVLLAALAGSPHCAGMCGPFVAFYAGSTADGRRRWNPAPHLAYNAGRLFSYVGLGALAGGFGAAFDLAGERLVGVQRTAAVVAGLLIVAWGTLSLLRELGMRTGAADTPAWVRRLAAGALGRIGGLPASARALAVGTISVLLPCGFLYAFVITAAGAGTPLGGAAVMAFFWAGTLPVMAAVGAGLGLLAGRFRRRVPVLTAIALIAVGLFAVAGRVPMIGADLTGGRTVPASLEESARQAHGDDGPPVCPRHAPH